MLADLLSVLLIRLPLHVEGPLIGNGISQDDVMLAGKVSARRAATRVAPHDLVAETLAPENGVHEFFEVMAGGRVAVQIDAARRFEDSAHLDQPHPHETQIRSHVVAIRQPRPVDDGHHLGPVVLQLVYPLGVDIVVPGPTILEPRPRGKAVGGGVKVPALVERRIGRHQIHRRGVDPPQKREVIAVEQRPVADVALSHRPNRPTATARNPARPGPGASAKPPARPETPPRGHPGG